MIKLVKYCNAASVYALSKKETDDLKFNDCADTVICITLEI